LFSSGARRSRREAKAEVAKVADRARLEEALAPYDRAVVPIRRSAGVDVIDLREAPAAPRARSSRRSRPLIYSAS
jgi:hypothetical protein